MAVWGRKLQDKWVVGGKKRGGRDETIDNDASKEPPQFPWGQEKIKQGPTKKPAEGP